MVGKIRHLVPQIQQPARHRRPGQPGFGMRGLIAVAAVLVRYPAKRPAVAHAHRERLAGARHARHKQRRGREHGPQLGKQSYLLGDAEIARQVPETGQYAHVNPRGASPPWPLHLDQQARSIPLQSARCSHKWAPLYKPHKQCSSRGPLPAGLFYGARGRRTPNMRVWAVCRDREDLDTWRKSSELTLAPPTPAWPSWKAPSPRCSRTLRGPTPHRPSSHLPRTASGWSDCRPSARA